MNLTFDRPDVMNAVVVACPETYPFFNPSTGRLSCGSHDFPPDDLSSSFDLEWGPTTDWTIAIVRNNESADAGGNVDRYTVRYIP